MGPSFLSRLSAALALAALLSPTLARADLILDDPHLNVIPRSPSEAARIKAITAPTSDFTAPEPFEARPAGAATTRARTNADAFSQASDNISFERELDFKVGNGLFRKLWVSAPASTIASDGLGPLYNARGCQNCHLKDGRGHTPQSPEDNAISMFLRISIPAPQGLFDAQTAQIQDYIATLPDPTYGGQLQEFASHGLAAEYRLGITYSPVEIALNGGEVITLRAPQYQARDLGFGPLHPQAMLSPRITPQMIGLGLLEAIPAGDILAGADPQDADGDGISGRANIVPSVEFGRPMLGRFGLKAGAPSIKEQTAAAFAGDIGISSPLAPAPWGDCTPAQSACRRAPHGEDSAQDGFEISGEGLDLVTFYSRNLAVPARRDIEDPQVLRGKEIFYQSGCIACHTPKFVTHRLDDQPEQSFQLIWPYSDMLLHDMGDGLADNRPEARATGNEWRTAPLWGIGLTEQVSGHSNFLHDGRARTLLEAVLWHGGEAQTARDAIVASPPADRAALIRFLESL
ncbi:MAG: di-heme oxidoredictase family protein [Paracoccaceae bacterium]